MARLDLDAHEAIARAAQPGPWQWYGNTKHCDVSLATVHGGRVFVMQFARWGMRYGQPRFQVDHRMRSLAELTRGGDPMGARFEVSYRKDFVGIGHPDATHIAANDPTTALALITRIRELESACETAAQNIESDGVGAGWLREVVAKGVILPATTGRTDVVGVGLR